MNKNTGIIIGVITLVVIVGGIYASMSNNDNAMIEDKVKDTTIMKANDQAMMEKDAKKDKDAMMDKETGKSGTMMKSGSYEAYAPEKVMLASTTHDVVLFFRAGWCPTCRALDADIKANLSKIPSDLAILDVDYDNSTTLKQKYGVTYQHTFVQLDKDSTLIKKWSGSPTLAALVGEVK